MVSRVFLWGKEGVLKKKEESLVPEDRVGCNAGGV